MQLTVREIIKMIDNNTLHYDQTTQRKFIYNSIKEKTDEAGEITKAGKLIRAILYLDIQLPAVYFWKNTDGTYNIHDGKQRILTLYYALSKEYGDTVVTNLPIKVEKDGETISINKEVLCSNLNEEQREKLLNYTFDVVVKEGSKEDEEISFFEINTNSVNLTDYECLRGMFYGRWFTGFEEYLINKSNYTDGIKKTIGRGEQAILFLGLCANCLGENKDVFILNIKQNLLRIVRNDEFDESKYHLDEIINVYAELSRIIVKGKIDLLLQVAKFIEEKLNDLKCSWDIKRIYGYYKEITKENNDVVSWDLETHKKALDQLMTRDVRLDGKRFFDKAIKSELYRKNQKCAVEGCTECNFNKLEVDHIIPWSKGGRTNIENAQLLCKSHNSSKCDKDDNN